MGQPVLILVWVFGGYAVCLRDPVAKVDELAALAAKRTKGITCEWSFLAASRALHIHGHSPNNSAQEIMIERAGYPDGAELPWLDLPDLRVIDEAYPVDFGSLGLHARLKQ